MGGEDGAATAESGDRPAACVPANRAATCARHPVRRAPAWPTDEDAYTIDEIMAASAGFFGKVSAGLGAVIEYVFKSSGRPTGYILGTEGGGAFLAGAQVKGALAIAHAGEECAAALGSQDVAGRAAALAEECSITAPRLADILPKKPALAARFRRWCSHRRRQAAAGGLRRRRCEARRRAAARAPAAGDRHVARRRRLGRPVAGLWRVAAAVFGAGCAGGRRRLHVALGLRALGLGLRAPRGPPSIWSSLESV